MVSEQIIEEENSCSSTGGGGQHIYHDEKSKHNLISTDNYINNDDSASPRFNNKRQNSMNRVSPFRNFGYHAGPLMEESNNFTLPDI
jgi:hypothetical protein